MTEVDSELGVAALIEERASETYQAYKDTIETLTRSVEEFKEINRPLVLCEGQTDVMYITKAIQTADKADLLDNIEIREIGVDGQGSGKDSLKKFMNWIHKDPALHKGQYLIIFDCDVEGDILKNVDQKLYVFRFQKQNNPHFESGIENNLPAEICEEIKNNNGQFWLTREKTKSGGLKLETHIELKKTAVCNYICGLNDPHNFVNFEGVIQRIEEFANAVIGNE